MSQVIYCDFRRTERRNKMDRVLRDIYYIAEVEKQKNPKITEDDLFIMPRVQLLNNICCIRIMVVPLPSKQTMSVRSRHTAPNIWG